MTRWRLLWLLLLPAVLTVDLMTESRGAAGSVIWAVDSTAGLSILVWPLVVALSCADGVRIAKAPDIINAFPFISQLRVFGYTILQNTLGPCLGLILSTGIAITVAVTNGSTFSYVSLAPIPLAVLGTIAFASVGTAAGMVVKNFMTAPILAVATYGALAFDLGNFAALTHYFGATTPEIIFHQFTMMGLYAFLVTVVLLFLCGFALFFATQRFLPSLIAVTILCTFLLVSLSHTAQLAIYQPRDARAWPCQSSTLVTVCLPLDQAYRLTDIAAEASQVTALLQPLDSSIAPLNIDFTRFEWEFPHVQSPAVVGAIVLNATATCLVLDSLRVVGAHSGAPLQDAELEPLLDDFWVVSDWVGSHRGYPALGAAASRDEAQRALQTLRACTL